MSACRFTSRLSLFKLVQAAIFYFNGEPAFLHHCQEARGHQSRHDFRRLTDCKKVWHSSCDCSRLGPDLREDFRVFRLRKEEDDAGPRTPGAHPLRARARHLHEGRPAQK
jgi:hypothetical protein